MRRAARLVKLLHILLKKENINNMDKELQGITNFLVERAKRQLQDNPVVDRIYFIQRYPDKPKLVYSPIDCAHLFNMALMWLIPTYLHAQWAIRKRDLPENTELVAICALVSHKYAPKNPLMDYMDKAGSEVLVISVHTKDAIHAFQMFYDSTTKTFDAMEEVKMAIVGVAKNLYPKNP